MCFNKSKKIFEASSFKLFNLNSGVIPSPFCSAKAVEIYLLYRELQ